MRSQSEQMCWHCDEVFYEKVDNDLVCPQCAHTPSESAPEPTETVGPWESFRRQREEYSGFYGDDRVKMIGGFEGVWHDDGFDGYL